MKCITLLLSFAGKYLKMLSGLYEAPSSNYIIPNTPVVPHPGTAVIMCTA